jgi:hypothetical protein
MPVSTPGVPVSPVGSAGIGRRRYTGNACRYAVFECARLLERRDAACSAEPRGTSQPLSPLRRSFTNGFRQRLRCHGLKAQLASELSKATKENRTAAPTQVRRQGSGDVLRPFSYTEVRFAVFER